MVTYSRKPEIQRWDKMANSKVLKWKEGLMIGGLHSNLHKPVLDSLKNSIDLVPLKEIPCPYHWLPKEKALEFDVRYCHEYLFYVWINVNLVRF